MIKYTKIALLYCNIFFLCYNIVVNKLCTAYKGDNGMKSKLKSLWNYIEGINGLILILYSTLAFSAAIFIGNDRYTLYFLFSVVIIFLLSVIICPKVIRLVSKIGISSSSSAGELGGKKKILFNAIFFVVPLICFLIYYFAFYPGGFSIDSLSQYEQAIGNSYNDWHPVIQTLFAFKLPLTLTGGWAGSIVLFQILCFSAALWYSLVTILKHTNLKYAVAAMMFMLLNPYVGYIVMYPWKDVSFAIGSLILISCSLNIFFTKGKWITKPLNMAVFIIVSVLTAMFRHNAILFVFPLLFAVIFFVTKKRGLIMCLSVLALLAGIKYPLFTIMNVESPDQRQVETLGLPMTIIGAAVAHDPDALDEEIIDFAYRVAPKEVWEEEFKSGSYNSIKWHGKTDNYVIEEYGAIKILKMTAKCMVSSPLTTVDSLIRLTGASYVPYDVYDSAIKPYIASNTIGLTEQGNTILQTLVLAWNNSVQKIIGFIFNLGIAHLILIVVMLSKCKLNKFKDWRKIFFAVPVFAYNYGTSLLLTGYGDPPRFFFYTLILLPVILIFFLKSENEGGTDEEVQGVV